MKRLEIRLLGISGKAGSGKDAFLSRLNRNLTQQSFAPYTTAKFAGKLKEMAQLLTGEPYATFSTQEGKTKWLNEWDMTAREFLQKIGTEAIRNGLHTDAWVIATMSKIRANTALDYAITDVRFPNELKAVKKEGGISIRIERPGAGAGDHPSETSLDDAHFDFTFHNNGSLEEFYNNVDLFATNLINKAISIDASYH